MQHPWLPYKDKLLLASTFSAPSDEQVVLFSKVKPPLACLPTLLATPALVVSLGVGSMGVILFAIFGDV